MYAPNHVEMLKSKPKAMALYRYLIAHGIKPAEAFRRAVREAK